MQRIDSSILRIQLAKVPEHAEFRANLATLLEAINSLSTVRLPYLALIKLSLLMKEVEKNCYALRLEGEAKLKNTHNPELDDEITMLQITGVATIKSLIDDAEKLATQGTVVASPVKIKSSKHPNLVYGQYGIILKIATMISAYIGLLNVLTSSSVDQKSRLALALNLLPYEREFYYFIAVSRSEYTGS